MGEWHKPGMASTNSGRRGLAYLSHGHKLDPGRPTGQNQGAASRVDDSRLDGWLAELDFLDQGRPMRDFYATAAQVLPVLMLASLWESRFLATIRTQTRLPRHLDRLSGVLFWTKPRVRNFLIAVAVVTTAGVVASTLALAGLLGDSTALRTVVAGAVVLSSGTLLTRVTIDIMHATSATGSTTPAQAADHDLD